MNQETVDLIEANRNLEASQILSLIQADTRFRRRIYADDLNGLFGQQPVIELKMCDAVANFPRTEQTMLLLAGINRLLQTARLGGRAGWLATDDAEISEQIRMFAPAVVTAGILSQEEVNDLLALAGGDLYDRDLTEEDIQEALDATVAEADLASLRLRLANGYNAAVAAVDAGETDWQTLTSLIAEA